MRKYLIFIGLLLAALPGLAACSGGVKLPEIFATQTPTATLTPTIPPTPTASPTPTPTATPQPAARVGLGDHAIFLGDYNDALQQYNTALAASSDPAVQAAAKIGIGRTYLLQKNFTPAIQILTEVLTNNPNNPDVADAAYFRAQAYMAMQNPQRAAESYAVYLELKPGVIDSTIQVLRGEALEQIGDYAGALAAYQAAAAATNLNGGAEDIQIKIGQLFAATGDYENAVRTYLALYDTTQNDYTKATLNLLTGQAYLAMGLPDQAYARFSESVASYPRSYDTYSGLVALVNAGVAVNELDRGLVDYFAGQYGYAVEAFDRYITTTPEHDGTAHYYKALALLAVDQPAAAITEWQALINDHAGDTYWIAAHDEIATAQWAYLGQPTAAAKTLTDFVALLPGAAEAPQYLFTAARMMERAGKLNEAATLWERVINEYPSSDQGYRALFLSAVTYYRLSNYDQARLNFQRAMALGTTSEDQSAAYLWIGKTYQAQGDAQQAVTAWQYAVSLDPTGYYSERAGELIDGKTPFSDPTPAVTEVDLQAERPQAESWLRVTFNLPAGTDLSGMGDLAGDPRVQRGDALWQLGLYSSARSEFENLREELVNDPAGSFRLMNHLLDLGFYRPAILACRQILDLAGMDDAGTLAAPNYFNHIRFGLYYKETVFAAAQSEALNPFMLYGLIRQESLFEGHAESAVGAQGVMQIMPTTGEEIARNMGWPEGYTAADLSRPRIAIPMGAWYLALQRDLMDGNLYAALAAYNGGPGNAAAWLELSGNDLDLFLEVIRYDETRNYIQNVVENYKLYLRMYSPQESE